MRKILITGANSGIGKELARQLLARDTDVYLGFRNAERGAATRAQLGGGTVVEIDVSDLASVRAAAAALPALDAVLLNAGGTGGERPDERTAAGVTQLFAVNVLGHVALVDALVAQDKLGDSVVYVGSEAARGVPGLGIPRPAIDDVQAALDGWSGGAAAYGEAKCIAALWIGALARRHPGKRFITMSPGGTRGTELGGGMMNAVPHELTHTVDTAAARLVRALDDDTLRSGAFYGSATDRLTGELVDQATIDPSLADPARQDDAAQVLARLLSR